MSTSFHGTQILVNKSSRPRLQCVRIDIKSGPDKGKSLIFDIDPIRIGTTEGCHLQLTDSSISGVHLELSRGPHGLLVRDLGSTNGTFLADTRIQSVGIEKQTDFTIGNTLLRVRPEKTDSPVSMAPEPKFGDLLGGSVPMRALFAVLKKIAAADSTVLISGETGTGKELAAAAVRDHGKRSNKPFIVVDCAALPANLIESELFGHERGAFTGAGSARAGAFERAQGGTIFLDEVGELPLALQPALLGVLERREIRRVGGNKQIPLDVRVINATNRDLAQEVARGAFRADLYYRLAVVEVRMPPLRQRSEDIPMLIEHFLDQLPGDRPIISQQMLEQLTHYPWPGNLRELRNVIERAAMMCEPPQIAEQRLAAVEKTAQDTLSNAEVDLEQPFKEQKNALIATFEKRYVQALMEHTKGNIAKAARTAGIDRMYMYKLIERCGVDVKPQQPTQ